VIIYFFRTMVTLHLGLQVVKVYPVRSEDFIPNIYL